jgi:hypothetical protein
MEIEVIPIQPPEIEQAIAAALLQKGAAPDPWWRAGIEEALET